MKTNIIYLASILVLFSLSCSKSSNEKELLQIEHFAQEALMENQFQKADETYLAALNEIEENMNYINKSRGIILQYQPEMGESGINQKERIIRNIQLINSLLDENELKIKKMESLTQKTQSKNKFLITRIDDLKAELNEQKEQVNFLKKELLQREYDITELNLKLNRMQMDQDNLYSEMDELKKELNTAYYVIGSYKELKDLGVIDKKGGIFSLGSTKVLNASFDKEDFSEINTNDSIILVYGRKAKIITQHPEDSYEIIEDNNQVSYLQITEPNQFWRASRYLVVEVR